MFVTGNQPGSKPWIIGSALAKHKATKHTSKTVGDIGVDVGQIVGSSTTGGAAACRACAGRVPGIFLGHF